MMTGTRSCWLTRFSRPWKRVNAKKTGASLSSYMVTKIKTTIIQSKWWSRNDPLHPTNWKVDPPSVHNPPKLNELPREIEMKKMAPERNVISANSRNKRLSTWFWLMPPDAMVLLRHFINSDYTPLAPWCRTFSDVGFPLSPAAR